MKCPHCSVEFHDERKLQPIIDDSEGKWGVEVYLCPSEKCGRASIYLINAEIKSSQYRGWHLVEDSRGKEIVNGRRLVRPIGINRPPVPAEVPDSISVDYIESCLVLAFSKKASAALSRRCLQNVLRAKAGIKKGDLAKEIQEVLDNNSLPSYLAESIDAVRNIGNFAAHPVKSTATGEIVDVEEGEAEWSLDVLELLFDFYFVQPAIVERKKAVLNAKLISMGKPEMK